MTVISNSKKFIFVHPHKCAGTSIEIALENLLQWNDIILGSSNYGEKINNIYSQKFGIYKHSSADKIRKVVGEDIWHSYFTFSIVRHPLDRMVSLYEFLKKFQGNSRISEMKRKTKLFLFKNKHNTLFSKIKSIQKIQESDIHRFPGVVALLDSNNFSEFIVSVCNSNEPAAIPQFEVLSDKNKSDIAVDYVGKFENIQYDWEDICQRIGISITLPHKNQSSRTYKDWRKYYTLDDINFMVDRYKIDMNVFDYSV